MPPGQTKVVAAAKKVSFRMTVSKAQYAANKATTDAKICSKLGCTLATNCACTVNALFNAPAGRRLQASNSNGELMVEAAMPATAVAGFAVVKQYTMNLAGNTAAALSALLGITVSGTTAVVEAAVASMTFTAAAPSPPPPPPTPPPPPAPPPLALGIGEMSMVGSVKDYTTFFSSNVDGCYAKMAAPRIMADIVTTLGVSASLVHVTPTESATGSPWDNTGAKACPVRNGRRLEARGLSGHGECTTAQPTSCTCSTGPCFMQTRFVIVIRVPQADAAAAAAAAAAITTLLAATKAAMYSSAALTTLFPSLLLDGEYRSTMQLTGSSVTSVSSAYAATFYYSSPSPPPPTPVPVALPPPLPVGFVASPPPPPPSPPSPKKSPPPSPPAPPPPPAQCACDQLINGASVFNTCVKIQGKQRICNGLGLTNQGQSLCASDHYLCPSASMPSSSTRSCKDRKGKYREKKCAKKLDKGKCNKKKIAKKCRKTCSKC